MERECYLIKGFNGNFEFVEVFDRTLKGFNYSVYKGGDGYLEDFGRIVCEVDYEVYWSARELYLNDKFGRLQSLFNEYREEVLAWKKRH